MPPWTENWIIRPFNPVFINTLGAFAALLVLATVLLREKSEKTKGSVLVISCLLTLAGFGIYKVFLSMDAEYNEITAVMGGFNWWGELPLQLCNINMILIPVAVWKKSRPMMSFCFFVGPLGAMMALMMPGNGFDGYSLLLPRMIGYYGTHFMVFIEGLALGTFGLYRPRLRDLPGTVITILAVSFAVFLINLLLRWSGLHPKANYFFTVETEGNFLLDLFHSWVPFPYLYVLPGLGILIPYMLLVTLPFEIADRKQDGKENERR